MADSILEPVGKMSIKQLQKIFQHLLSYTLFLGGGTGEVCEQGGGEFVYWLWEHG